MKDSSTTEGINLSRVRRVPLYVGDGRRKESAPTQCKSLNKKGEE